MEIFLTTSLKGLMTTQGQASSPASKPGAKPGTPSRPPGAKPPIRPGNKRGPAAAAPVAPPPKKKMTFAQSFIMAGAICGFIGCVFIGGAYYLTLPPKVVKKAAPPEDAGYQMTKDEATPFRSFRNMSAGPGKTWVGSDLSSSAGRNEKNVSLKQGSPNESAQARKEKDAEQGGNPAALERYFPGKARSTDAKESTSDNEDGH